MNAAAILILYISLFAIQYAWEMFLTLLNRNHVKECKNNPPAFVERIMDTETYGRSVAYTLQKSDFGLITGTASSLFLLLLILTGTLGRLEQIATGLDLGVYTGGVIFFYLISLIFGLFSIPFSLYSQFVIEKKFGFNKMTFGLFMVDILKSILVSVLLTTPLLYGLFWFMDKAGELWWILAFAGFSLFQLIILVIYPTLIAPIFNKFTPLQDGSLRDRIISLAEKLNFKTSGIFVMDGSKRSKHSNAYFTGLEKQNGSCFSIP